MRQRTFSTGSRGSHDAPVSPQPPGSPRAGKRDPLRQFSVMSQGTNSEDEEKEKKAGERWFYIKLLGKKLNPSVIMH